MKLANRKAKFDRESGLSALESFANLGDTPDEWGRFRLKWPDFFPPPLTEWFYWFAEVWAAEFHEYPEVKEFLKPPLLFYRDGLRRVWIGKDQKGIFLKLLLGFEQDVKHELELRRSGLYLPSRQYTPEGKRKMRLGSLVPGQPADESKQTTVAGLPPGKPLVNGVTGAITWEFGCMLQQSVYELIGQRWRAMVCPECRKFLLADKTRQVYCSSICFGNMKRKRALDYWNRKGSDARDKRRGPKRGSKTHSRSKSHGV
jgi:hypothetical protein